MQASCLKKKKTNKQKTETKQPHFEDRQFCP